MTRTFASAASVASAAVAVVLAIAACSSDGATPPDPRVQECDVVGNMSAGASAVSLTGVVSGARGGRASAFELGGVAALSVIDAYQVDGAGRPVAELFVLHRGLAMDTARALVPVTLAQLRDPSFVPTGSFAVYAEAYDAEAGDYTRWLMGTAGCLRFGNVTAGPVGSVSGKVVIEGEWQDRNGASLGSGSAVATFTAALLRIRTQTAVLRDTLDATFSGGDSEPMVGSTVDAFQVLAPEQTRMTLVGSAPSADGFGRELWLSLNGVPRSGDSVALVTPTLEEARAGRANGPFIIVRQISYSGIPVRPAVRALWRASGGWVKLDRVVQTGPLGLCGWAEARFAFTTEPADAIAMSGPPPTAIAGTGRLSAIFTVLSPSDTLVDDTPVSSLATPAVRLAVLSPSNTLDDIPVSSLATLAVRLAAPRASRNVSCPT